MARNPHQSLQAATGMDVTSNPVSLPENRAARLQNVLTDRAGYWRAQGQLGTVLSGFASPVDGVSWYYGLIPAQDQLIIISGGQAYACNVILPPGQPVPSFGPPSPVGGTFQIGKRVRSVQYRTELLLVQDGGIQPQRYNGSQAFQVGINPPAAPTAIPNTPSGGAASNKGGIITYKTTYFDELFRESDLSVGTEINYTTNTGDDGLIAISYGSDPQVKGIYIYANTSGGVVYYRIATLYKALNQTVWEDNAADNSVNTGVPAASPGENGVPEPASVIAKFKLRVWLNSTTNAGILQVSGDDNPVQWTSLPLNAADGERIPLTDDSGDIIEGLTPFGSVLTILRRRLLYVLMRDDPTSYTIRPLHTRSGIAPDSIVRTDNELWYMADDGVYAINFDGSFLATKRGKEIEADVQALSRSAVEASIGWYVGNRYCLYLNNLLYIYDFDVNGWLQFSFGATINGAYVVEQQQAYPLTYIARSDTNAVSVLDFITTNQSVSNIVCTTRSFAGEERAQGQRKRSQRTLVFGSGTINYAPGNTNTITLSVDGGARTETTIALNGNPSRGILIEQQWDPSLVGYNNQLTLNLCGIGLVIGDIRHEWTVIG